MSATRWHGAAIGRLQASTNALAAPRPSRAACWRDGFAQQRSSRPRKAAWTPPASRQRLTTAAAAGKKASDKKKAEDDEEADEELDKKDVKQLINHVLELQDKIDHFEAQLQGYEDRGRDRAVALRAILRDDKQMDQLLTQDDDQLIADDEDSSKTWDRYRNSFTLLISKGYLRTVEALRTRIMASEWELGQRPIALQLGVSRFEMYCANNKVDISEEALIELYEDPTDLRLIADPHLRMHARAIITQTETEERNKAWKDATVEAKRLADRFTEAEFISKCIPDPLEFGVVDALKKVVMPLAKMGSK